MARKEDGDDRWINIWLPDWCDSRSMRQREKNFTTTAAAVGDDNNKNEKKEEKEKDDDVRRIM